VHKELKTGTLETAFDHPRLAAHALDGIAQFPTQVGHIETAQVAQLDPFRYAQSPSSGLSSGA
jgi:hypothetical protein